MGQKNDNFIDKTFTVLADILLKVLPATKDEKQAFSSPQFVRYTLDKSLRATTTLLAFAST